MLVCQGRYLNLIGVRGLLLTAVVGWSTRTTSSFASKVMRNEVSLLCSIVVTNLALAIYISSSEEFDYRRVVTNNNTYDNSARFHAKTYISFNVKVWKVYLYL
jgi:hypothetical protein